MLLHPLHGLPLIQKADVQVSILPDLLACQETERTDTIVECDNNHVATGRIDKRRAIVVAIGVRNISTTLNPEKHWKP